MKKVIYLHGLGGGDDDPRFAAYLRTIDIEYNTPLFSYELMRGNPHFFDLLVHMVKPMDYIIGNSMGGYLAYHLGKATGKPTLCFNPAISKITMSYGLFNRTVKYEPAVDQSRTLILLGTEDTTVNHKMTRDYLRKNFYPTDEIVDMVGETHSLTGKAFVNNLISFVHDTKAIQSEVR